MHTRDVVVVLGMGDIGVAISRRIGVGRTVVIADRSSDLLEVRCRELLRLGHDAVAVEVDVSSRDSVYELANVCDAVGPVRAMVHTAGMPADRASVRAILDADVLGTALVLDAFGQVVASGGSGLVVAPLATRVAPALPFELERALALTPVSDLLDVPGIRPGDFCSIDEAQAIANMASNARVAAMSRQWAGRGATLNSISPGVVSWGRRRGFVVDENGPIMRMMVADAGSGRLGTPDDVAEAASFLLSPQASFITGTSLVVDGGVYAAARFPERSHRA